MFSVEQMRGSAANIESALNEIARFPNSLRVDHADNNIDRVFLKTFKLAELRDGDELTVHK